MKAFLVFVSFSLTILFLFIFFFLLLRLLQDCIGSIQVNSAMPNRFADCHRLKKGELENTKETKKNIGFFSHLKFALIACPLLLGTCILIFPPFICLGKVIYLAMKEIILMKCFIAYYSFLPQFYIQLLYRPHLGT